MSHRIRYELAPEPTDLRSLRGEVRDQLEAWGVAQSPANHLLLALDEIVSNSIEHGVRYRRNGTRLAVDLSLVDEQVRLDFRDPDVPDTLVEEMSRMLESARGNPPPLTDERGRGFFLMDDNLDEVWIGSDSAGGMRVHGRLAVLHA